MQLLGTCIKKEINEQRKDLKSGSITKFVVSHNVLTNHTFDFHNSTIFAFIHDRDKRRIIEACSITHFDTII